MAALVAASIVPREIRTRAVSTILMGLTIATVIGVPVATLLSQIWGWRSTFVIVSVLAVLTMVLVAAFAPRDAARPGAGALRELAALKNRQVWLTLGVSAIGFGGMFAVFSYVKPTMMALAGLTEAGVPFVLALFGLGMVAGNVVGARLADRALMPVIGGVLVWSALVLALFSLTSAHLVLGAVNMMLVGTLVSLGPTLQVRLMDVAGDAQALAAALNHAAFNLANALGAWIGGVAIDAGLGWASTSWVGALLALGGLLVYAMALWGDRGTSSPAPDLAAVGRRGS